MKLAAVLILAGAVALSTGAADRLSEDRAQFDALWSSYSAKNGEPGVKKNYAFQMYEWIGAQYIYGYCSRYLRADDAELMRHFPNEDEMMKSDFGRMLLKMSGDSFREGMADRQKTKPTRELCNLEFTEIGRTMEKLSSTYPVK